MLVFLSFAPYICTQNSWTRFPLHWKTLLVTFVFKSVSKIQILLRVRVSLLLYLFLYCITCNCCLKWSYLNSTVVLLNRKVDLFFLKGGYSTSAYFFIWNPISHYHRVVTTFPGVDTVKYETMHWLWEHSSVRLQHKEKIGI